MTIISEFQSTRASSYAADSDFVVVGLWSALGLCVSALFVVAGFTNEISVFQTIAW